MQDEMYGFKIGDIVYSDCSDWEDFNPMIVVGFSPFNKGKYFEVVCKGNDGLLRSEVPEAWTTKEDFYARQ
jgi:hypothetical protein